MLKLISNAGDEKPPVPHAGAAPGHGNGEKTVKDHAHGGMAAGKSVGRGPVIKGHGAWQMDRPLQQLDGHCATEHGQRPKAGGALATFGEEQEKNRDRQANVDKRIAQFGDGHQDMIPPGGPQGLKKVIDGLIGLHQRVFFQDGLQYP